MITKISLINLHLTYNCIFFLVIRIFKIYLPSNLQIYNIVLTTVIMLYSIFLGLIYILQLEVCTFRPHSFILTSLHL